MSVKYEFFHIDGFHLKGVRLHEHFAWTVKHGVAGSEDKVVLGKPKVLMHLPTGRATRPDAKTLTEAETALAWALSIPVDWSETDPARLMHAISEYGEAHGMQLVRMPESWSAPKVVKSLTALDRLLATKEWAGSEVTSDEGRHYLKHPSGARASVWRDATFDKHSGGYVQSQYSPDHEAAQKVRIGEELARRAAAEKEKEKRCVQRLATRTFGNSEVRR